MENSRIDLPIGVTLDRFIKSKESEYPSAVGAFSQLLRDVALAAKVVNRELNKAGLIDIMGSVGMSNSGGDQQKKLDLLGISLVDRENGMLTHMVTVVKVRVF